MYSPAPERDTGREQSGDHRMASTASGKKPTTTLTVLTVVVVALGIVAVVVAAARQALIEEHAWLMMIVLALLVAPVSTIHIPGIKADVVLGDMVTFSCAVLFGPSAAVIAAVADGAVTSLRLTKSPRKFLYNVATCATSMAGSSLVTRLVFDRFGVRTDKLSMGYLVGSMAIFTLSYFLISTLLIASYLAFSNDSPLVQLWKQKFLWTSISYLGSGVTAVLSLSLVERIGYFVFVVVIGVMLVMFVFYRSYFNNVEKKALSQGS
jgi:hypothetical protein